MTLHPKSFDRIKNGQKKDELRLNDDKRRLINVGDQIEFRKRPNLEEKIFVEVTSLTRYANLEDLYEGVKERYLDSTKERFTNGMRQYYSREDVRKFGALEIGIKLIE